MIGFIFRLLGLDRSERKRRLERNEEQVRRYDRMSSTMPPPVMFGDPADPMTMMLWRNSLQDIQSSSDDGFGGGASGGWGSDSSSSDVGGFDGGCDAGCSD